MIPFCIRVLKLLFAKIHAPLCGRIGVCSFVRLLFAHKECEIHHAILEFDPGEGEAFCALANTSRVFCG